jgi:hypothetical protein
MRTLIFTLAQVFVEVEQAWSISLFLGPAHKAVCVMDRGSLKLSKDLFFEELNSSTLEQVSQKHHVLSPDLVGYFGFNRNY